MGDPERSRREEFLKTQEPFKRNGFKIIRAMVDWCNTIPGSRHLVDEILHSIFFLGKINKVPYSPAEIIPEQQMLEDLENRYPRPFEFYLKKLPQRSPFSCVLDMIVLKESPENENQIKQSLQAFRNSLERGFLVSSTICVSWKENSPARYYGVSMSTTGPNAGKIMVAASCCSTWDDYVAGAVMTYYPLKVKKQYFDGTIKLPKYVSCKAFNFSRLEEMDPCISCANLFGLQTRSEDEWEYGNCAEPESVSNLLKNEAEVKRDARPTAYSCTPENRKTAKDSVVMKLKAVLSTIQFKTWDGTYYEAQRVWA